MSTNNPIGNSWDQLGYYEEAEEAKERCKEANNYHVYQMVAGIDIRIGIGEVLIFKLDLGTYSNNH